MAIPTYDQFMEPVLRFLAGRPGGATATLVYEAAAAGLGLSEDDQAQLLPSGGQAVFKNRIGWAHDRLKRAGLSSSRRRGFWKLTEAGFALATAADVLSVAQVERIATMRAGSAHERLSVAQQSPEERITAALAEVRESVAHELLDLIGTLRPVFFEQLVLDLLRAMGYEVNRANIQRVGGPGEGGIDGIISSDKLGLEKVYMQAKRWQSPVESLQVQEFMSALREQVANKGVLLTTSTFTKGALDVVEFSGSQVVLVDGEQLASLMIDHGVGVATRELRVPKVDGDYFEDA